MKTTMNVILGLMVSATALAQGNGAGNGGGVHVCYDGKKLDENGNRIIKSVEMYDLYEGRELYKMKGLPPSTLVSESDFLSFAYQNALEKSGYRERYGFASRLEAGVKLVEHIISPTDQVLELIPDAHRLMHGEDCEYDQLANWHDRTGQLLVSRKYYEYIQKSPIDLAAFKTHESFYFLDRKYNGAKFSDDSRESNAMVYLGGKGQLKVQVKEFAKVKRFGNIVTIVHPQWDSAACINYITGTRWSVSFARLNEYRLPRLTTVLSYEVFGGGEREEINLNRYPNISFGTAIGEFILSFIRFNWSGSINAEVRIGSETCDRVYKTEVANEIKDVHFSVEE